MTQALTERSGVGRDRDRKREERSVHIMWCPCVCYTDPFSELPACVFVSTENLHVFQVSTADTVRHTHTHTHTHTHIHTYTHTLTHTHTHSLFPFQHTGTHTQPWCQHT